MPVHKHVPAVRRVRIPASAGAALAAAALGVAGLPDAVAEPVPTTTTPGAEYQIDDRGYVDTGARCDQDQALMAYGRTSRALVAICVEPDGELEYRGVRLSDEAALTMAADRASDGSIIATKDGVTYAVSPTMFMVSEGDSVIYRDSWTEFGQPRFSGGSATSTATGTATPSASATPSGSAAPTTSASAQATTVSTTTVSLPPSPPKAVG